MQIKSLFNLISDAKDLLDLFTGAEDDEQLVSRLERIKRHVIDAHKQQEPSDLLLCLEGLRNSVGALLEDTLEMSASLDEPESSDDLEAELADLVEQGSESENAEAPAEDADLKNSVQDPQQ
jgi:hypothetical protein